MKEAYQIVFNIFNKYIDLIFNKFELFDGIYLGNFLVAVLILSVVVANITYVPKGFTLSRKGGKDD